MFLVIGNPENRRVTLFQEALRAEGLPPARVVRWLDLVRGEDALGRLPDELTLVRIDSFGEDFDVERALLARGWEDARTLGCSVIPPAVIARLKPDHGRICAPRQAHLGFLRALADVERGCSASARPSWRVLNAPESIARLFDKRACVDVFRAAGVPIPRPLRDVASPDELRDSMRDAGMPRVFVKLTCGSSASCLALYQLEGEGGEWLFTSMEVDRSRLYNSLRVRRYAERATIDRLLKFLFAEGSHVEEEVPKATLDGAPFDLRVVVIAGEPAFTVVRKSAHPITNLHLGGTRGTLEELYARVPRATLDAAYESCRRVFFAHDCLHVGVDVMIQADLEGHRILEANAFGDLLPNLTRDGATVYAWEIRAARGG